MEKDMLKLNKILKIPEFDVKNLKKLNCGHRPDGVHYRDYYNEELKNLVYKYHNIELNLFNYTF